MKNLKKLSVLLLAGLMLTACGKTENKKAEEKKESNTNTSSNQKFSNNSSSVSSGSNSSKKSNGSSSSSTNSNSISTDANDYLCLENNCGKHFKTYSELQKHQKEQGHGGYAVGHESFEWPDDWN